MRTNVGAARALRPSASRAGACVIPSATSPRGRTSRTQHAVRQPPPPCPARVCRRGSHRRPRARRPARWRRNRRVQAGGRGAEGRRRADRRAGTAVHRRGPRDDQGGLGERVGGAAGGGERRAHRPRRRDPGNVLPAHRETTGGRRRRDGVRLRAARLPVHEVDPVPGAGGRRLVEGAGPVQGRAGLRGRPGARHLPPRLRPADDRDRRRQGGELRQAAPVVVAAEHAGRRSQARARRGRRGHGGRRRAGRAPARRRRRPADRRQDRRGARPHQSVRLRHQLAAGGGRRRDGATHGRQSTDRLQLGAQRLQRRQRLQPLERRVGLHGARLPRLRRSRRPVPRLRAGEPRGGHGDGGHRADGRLRHRRQARRRPRGRQGAQQALEPIGRPEAWPLRRVARSRTTASSTRTSS